MIYVVQAIDNDYRRLFYSGEHICRWLLTGSRQGG
jgi:hypothetical protein